MSRVSTERNGWPSMVHERQIPAIIARVFTILDSAEIPLTLNAIVQRFHDESWCQLAPIGKALREIDPITDGDTLRAIVRRALDETNAIATYHLGSQSEGHANRSTH